MQLAVMGHQHEPPWLFKPRLSAHGAKRVPRRLEPGIAMPFIRLQMGAFGPFIPGVHKDQASVRIAETRRGILDGVPQPPLEKRGRGVLKNRPCALTARFIVPGRKHTPEQGIIRRDVMIAALRKNAIVVDGPAIVRVQAFNLVGDVGRIAVVRRKLDGSVKTVAGRIIGLERLSASQEHLPKAIVFAPFSPARRRRLGVGQQARPVDQQQRLAADSDVVGVTQIFRYVLDKKQVVGGRVLLFDDRTAVSSIPVSRPILIRPAQAERKIDIRVFCELGDRVFQQGAPGEPVEIETEGRNIIQLGQFNLLLLDGRHPQIVVAELAWPVWLIVANELRQGSGDVRPIGEAPPPGGVVLGNGMVLRKIEGDQLGDGRRQWRLGRDRNGGGGGALSHLGPPVGQSACWQVRSADRPDSEARQIAPHLRDAVPQEMHHGIDTGGRHVRAGREVASGTEEGSRIAPFETSISQVMLGGIQT